MKRVSGFLLLVAVAVVGSPNQPASAQGFNVRKNALPDASQVERSRQRVQIVDPSPIVTDTRKPPEDTTTYMINIPPLKQSKNTVVQIGNGGAGNNGGQTSVPIQSNNLPNASFKTNIPAGGPASSKGLPPGTSSNGLGQLAGRKMPGPGGQQPSASHAGAAPPVAPTVKMYDNTTPAAVSSTLNRHTKESVKAELHRGDLVRK
jgi:hypothetical protein